MQKSLLVSAFVAAVAAPGVLVAQQSGTPTAPAARPAADSLVTRSANGEVEAGNVLAVARNAGNFTVLVRAIEAAGLAETLQGEGPFTLFAPTDEAFAKLPQGQLDSLLANPAQLKVLLLGHVLPTRVTAADAAAQPSATTVTGTSVAIAAKDSGVTVGGAKVVKADIAASNGVVHAVDAVILPAASPATTTDTTAAAKPATVPPTEPTAGEAKPATTPAEVKPESKLPEPTKSEPAKPEPTKPATVPPAGVPLTR
jgi:uncharacterized surface protein with fasciclin (FAS1) repeats